MEAMNRMITSNLEKIPSSSWNAYYMKHAIASVHQNMEKNEDWLLCAILGCNNDWKLFEQTNSQEVWRGRDHLYAFTTEKDIQARLAAELYKQNQCHVHVESSVYVKRNKRRGRRSKLKNHRPDVFLLSTRQREKRKSAKEDHLEGTAVEIKYFGRGNTVPKKKDIKELIMDDMKKLRAYIRSRVQPRVDNGFFLCIDESGVASDVLAKIMAQKGLKKKGIGYFVLTPKYITERRDYPLNLEKYQLGLERSSAYVMDRALGKLKRDFAPEYDREKVLCDFEGDYRGSAGPSFHIWKGESRVGWAYLDWEFKDGRKTRSALIIHLYDLTQHLGNTRSVKWSIKAEAWRYSRKDVRPRVYLLKSRLYKYDLNRMDALAEEIYRKVRKIVVAKP